MKKIIKILLFAFISCLAFGLLAGCGKKKSYTVNYDVNGGFPVKASTYTVDENFSLPTPNPGSDPAMYGFKFTGWYYDEACTLKVNRKNIDTSYAKDGAFTFYAGWSDLHTIYFDSMTSEAISSVTYHYRDLVDVSTLPTPQDYVVGAYSCEFICWVQANNDKRLTENFKMASEDMYLYALYNTGVNDDYDLSEDGYMPQNTLANTQIFDYTLDEGEVYSVDMKFPSIPTNYDGDSGIAFAAESFNEATDEFSNYIVMFVSAYNNGLGALDFYGTRQFLNTETNEIETDFGRIARYPVDGDVLFGTEYAKKMTKYAEGNEACTFTYTVRKLGNSWYIGVDGVEYIKISIGGATAAGGKTVGEGLTGGIVGLRAKTREICYDKISVEEAKLTLHFDAEKGTVSSAQKVCTYGEEVGQLPTPTRTGYEFKYWYYEKDGEKIRVNADSTFDTSVWQIFLKAYWEKPSATYYNIQFKTGVDGYLVDGITGWTSGNAVNVPTLLWSFYSFSGDWYYDEARTTLVDLTELDESKAVDGTITLYAGFEKSTNKFTNTAWGESNGVYSGSGTTLVNNIEFVNGQTLTVDVTLPKYNTLSPYGNSYLYFGATGLESASAYYRIVILGNVDANVNSHGAIQLYKSGVNGSLKSANRAGDALKAAQYSAGYQTYMTSHETFTFKLGIIVGKNSITCTVNGVVLYTYEGSITGKLIGFGSTTGFAVAFSNLEITATETDGFVGEGTERSPYLIQSADDLKRFAEKINAGQTYAGEYFKMTDDIDLGADTEWTPIGVGFAGTLNGDNHTVSNVTITSTERKIGFFVELNAGTVKNLKLSVRITSTADTVGGLVSLVSGTVTIENCEVTGSVSASHIVGGIVGYVNATQVTIKNCVNRANVTATVASGSNSFVGGVIGASADNKKVVIDGAKNYGAITANGHFIGGVAGLLRACTGAEIKNAYNFGNITAGQTSEWVGGVVGCNRVAMTNCYCLQTSVIKIGETEKAASEYAAYSSAKGIAAYIAGSSTGVTATGGGLCNADGQVLGA